MKMIVIIIFRKCSKLAKKYRRIKEFRDFLRSIRWVTAAVVASVLQLESKLSELALLSLSLRNFLTPM